MAALQSPHQIPPLEIPLQRPTHTHTSSDILFLMLLFDARKQHILWAAIVCLMEKSSDHFQKITNLFLKHCEHKRSSLFPLLSSEAIEKYLHKEFCKKHQSFSPAHYLFTHIPHCTFSFLPQESDRTLPHLPPPPKASLTQKSSPIYTSIWQHKHNEECGMRSGNPQLG